MAKKYRKKPVIIEAVQWTGLNVKEIQNFTQQDFYRRNTTDADLIRIIDTLEGTHETTVGDFIIKGVHGEFYPCKPDIFEKTYEEVNDN